MRRLITDKKVSEMGMYELAYNFCYVGENGSARYRDYSSDVDCRELIKKMMVNFGVVESGYWDDVSNGAFDDEMMGNLIYGTNNMQGLIALFYRNMWAMADLREILKHFEDMEEQGKLIKFDCCIGDIVYRISNVKDVIDSKPIIYDCKVTGIKKEFNSTYYYLHADINEDNYSILVDKWFDRLQIGYEFYLTKEEAEKALERLECD